MQKRERQNESNGVRDEAETPVHFVPLSQIRPSKEGQLDIAAVRSKLANTRGKQYWKSLEEVADSDAFEAYLQKEFPQQAPRDMLPLKRRDFFRLMGATLALAGVGGCAYQPEEKIVPYVEQPELIVPGKPLYYATAAVRSGFAIGIVAEAHMGRPTKLEGNEKHPASLGATDAFTQAEVLGLYDPDRAQSVRFLGGTSSWRDVESLLGGWQTPLRKTQGAGLRILCGNVTSPSLTDQLNQLKKRYPQARVIQHEPVSRQNALDGARMAFGRPAQPLYHFDAAKRILSLDSNFLLEEPNSVRYARDFSKGRIVRDQLQAGQQPDMNRLYVVESTPSITGAKADHQVFVKPSQIEAVARYLANGLGIAGAGSATPPAGVQKQWLDAALKDLQDNVGGSVVIAGAGQTPVVHALVHAINDKLGATGKTVTYIEAVGEQFETTGGTLKELVADIDALKVEALIILGGNPVYNAPADIELGAAISKLGTQGSQIAPGQKRIAAYLGSYDDETGILCQWQLPESHFLEAWSDARAYDGTATVVQPLIRPMYETRSAHEVVSLLVDPEPKSGYEIVREYWMKSQAGYSTTQNTIPTPAVPGGPTGVASIPITRPTPAFEKFWHKVLTDGVIPNTAAKPAAVTAGGNYATPPAAAGGGQYELVFRPDPTIWDGRYSNNGWQQEVPKPLCSLSWDNALLIGPATAEALQVRSNDMVEVTVAGRKLKAPVWILPGQPKDVLTLTLGYGRTHAGKVGNGQGFNAYALRGSDSTGFATGVSVTKIPGWYQLVGVQQHFRMEGRDIVRIGTLEELQKNPKDPKFAEKAEEHDTLYDQTWPSDRQPEDEAQKHIAGPDPGKYEPKVNGEEVRAYHSEALPAWGMVIDQSACIGCNACSIACQAENNIATVGKDMVDRHRQMHWIRIDNYYTGPLDQPEAVFQPVPCMHCEKAPCEPVCPVEATSHSAEGLNEMTYNRCIGTRYCSNNCPYKVRRFNFLQFSDQQTPQIQLMRNPDVTVRSRGVMEKCTYCVQRINWARIEAEKEERAIADGDVITACQQVCPTQAIVFGNINDKTSRAGKGSYVREVKANVLNYSLLEELVTVPRTTYLPAMRNPNPAVPLPKRVEHDGPFSPEAAIKKEEEGH